TGWAYSAFNSTGTFIAVENYHQGHITIWSAIDGSLAAGPFVHNQVCSVAFSSSGESIVSASYDGTVKTRSIKTGIAQAAITFSSLNTAQSVSYSPNGTLLVSSPTGRLENSDKSVKTDVAESATVARYSPDGKYAVVGHTNGELVVQHAGNGIVAYGPYKVVKGQFGWMALSPNGKYVTVAEGAGKRVRVLDLLTGKDVKLMLEHPSDMVVSASFSPN
ncbi:YVTN repeat-like/Quino protein amine dehydrogenase, partial [Ramaria rubella]